jgi:alpha-glucosidase (family GH31 glycosyl hydrolase)
MFDNETTHIYRRFVYIHYEFIPYFLSAGSQSMEGNVPVLYPLTDKNSLKPIRNWGYLLWRDVYVSPIVDNVTSLSVTFPPNEVWVDYWDHSVTYNGGDTVEYSCPMDRYPIFLRAGAIIPLHVHSALSVFGDERFSDFMTFYIAYPSVTRSGYQQVRQWKSASQEVWYSIPDPNTLAVTTSASSYDLLFLFEGLDRAPKYIKGTHVIREEESVESLLKTHEDGWLWERGRLLLRLRPSQPIGHTAQMIFS